MRTKTTLSFLAVAGIAVAALTGCSGSQSVADACGVVNDSLLSVQSELTEATAQMNEGSFTAVVDGFNTLETSLNDAAGKISNEEVKTAVTNLSTSIASFGDLFDGVADGDTAALAENAEGMTTASTDMQTAYTDLQTLCTE